MNEWNNNKNNLKENHQNKLAHISCMLLIFFLCQLINTESFCYIHLLQLSTSNILFVLRRTHANYGRMNSRTIVAVATVTSSFTPIIIDIQSSLSVHIKALLPYKFHWHHSNVRIQSIYFRQIYFNLSTSRFVLCTFRCDFFCWGQCLF